MAKRASTSRSASIASASTLSNIIVAATAPENSSSEAGSPSSTPPTSLPEESTGDVSSVKQASVTSATSKVDDNADTTRRSARPRSSVESYKLGRLSDLQYGKASKGKETRTFSGDTLVNDREDMSESTPQRKKDQEDQLDRNLDMSWEVGGVSGKASASAPRSPPRQGSRNSVALGRISQAVDNLKSALGKRGREAVESGKEALGLKHKRQSGRVRSIEQDKAMEKALVVENEDVGGDDSAAHEPASKRRKVLSTLASVSGSLNRRNGTKKTRKLWQTSGLYEGQADTGSMSNTSKSKKIGNASNNESTTEKVQQRTILPLPMFSALERPATPFKLPFDVFAPSQGCEKPKDWGKLAKNRFVGDAKELWRDTKLERSMCTCNMLPGLREERCGENCLNRHMSYECDDNNCALGEDVCTNRAFADLAARIKKHNQFDLGVDVVKTADRGFGVRANRAFEPGQIVMEYSGEVITQEECERRMNVEYRDKACYYLMAFDQGMVLDATRGSMARFVNHSCEPNCSMEKRFVAGTPRMALFAGPNGIMTGQELTYDYNFDNFSVENRQACHCGAEDCRGFLGPSKDSKTIRKEKVEKEKESLAAGLKRKAAQLLGSSSNNDDGERERKVLKKRKTVPLPRGWAYVDEKIEATRLVEDALQKGEDVPSVPEILISKKREEGRSSSRATSMGVVKDESARRSSSGSVRRVKTETRIVSSSTMTDTIRSASVRSISLTTAAPSAAKKGSKKDSLLARASSVLKGERRHVKADAAVEKENKPETANGVLRQSTLDFQRVVTPRDSVHQENEDKEALIDGEGAVKKSASGSLKRAASNAKDRIMGSVSRKGSKKGKEVEMSGHGLVKMVEGV